MRELTVAGATLRGPRGFTLRAHMHKAWWMLLAQGILALLAGALLLTNTDASLRAFAPFLGLYWLAGGALDILEALSHRGQDHAWQWSVLGGALGMAAGLLWLSRIWLGAGTLPVWMSTLIGLAAIVAGAANIQWAFRLRCMIEGEGWIMLWGAVSIILGVWVIGAPFISSDVWVFIAALCALISGAGMVMWVVVLATQHSPTKGRPRWLILGATIALAVAATGVWLFSQLQLASAAPLGIQLSAAAQRGQQVFQLHCAACHNASTHTKYGPGLAGLFDPGGPALPNGADYGGKLPNGADITTDNVAAWLRSGGRGQIGIMPPAGLAMSEAEIADVIEFLKALKK